MWLNIPEEINNDGLRIAGVCSGTGMLEYAIQAALEVRGIESSIICHIEREATAAAISVVFGQAAGHEPLVYSDMSEFDGTILRGKTDIYCAGLPCPAFSEAGKKKGNKDKRAWGENFKPDDQDTWGPQPQSIRLVEEIMPGIILYENVRNFFAGGFFYPVGRCLEELGYTYQRAIYITADSVGAFHKRERVFIMAVHHQYDIRARLAELAEDSSGIGRRGRSNGNTAWCKRQIQAQGLRCELADCEGNNKRGNSNPKKRSGMSSGRRCGELADCYGFRYRGEGNAGKQEAQPDRRSKELADTRCQRYQSGQCRQSFLIQGPTASKPTSERRKELGNCENSERRPGAEGIQNEAAGRWSLSPDSSIKLPLHAPGINAWGPWAAIAEMDPSRMPSIERGVPVVADGLAPSNVDLLRAGGNGVDTLAAATAFGTLLDQWINNNRNGGN